MKQVITKKTIAMVQEHNCVMTVFSQSFLILSPSGPGKEDEGPFHPDVGRYNFLKATGTFSSYAGLDTM